MHVRGLHELRLESGNLQRSRLLLIKKAEIAQEIRNLLVQKFIIENSLLRSPNNSTNPKRLKSNFEFRSKDLLGSPY